jgi:hypothetical protein
MSIHYKIDVAKTAKALGITRQYAWMIITGKRTGEKYREQLGLNKINKQKRKVAA